MKQDVEKREQGEMGLSLTPSENCCVYEINVYVQKARKSVWRNFKSL